MTRQQLLESAKPILFNSEMVRAILNGRKIVTRRIVKDSASSKFVMDATGRLMGSFDGKCGDVYPTVDDCKFQVGDVLYVRETWQHTYSLDGNDQIIEETGRYIYAASPEEWPEPDYWLNENTGEHQEHMTWRPSIHMPKEAARIFLRVTDVRVEKLQNITVDGVEQEGIPLTFPLVKMINSEHLKKFITLWNSTIKKQDFDRYGWNANPWVWVISFERIKI